MWTYDANGNRLTQGGSASSTYTVATTNNRLSAVSGALSRTYTYDAAGNVTADGTATYTYDDAGRLVSVTKASVTTTYNLNALGQRVRKTTAGVDTYFVYDDAGHLVGEYDANGALIQETIWFGDIPVGVLKSNGSGGVSLFYVHTDHLNTPRKISRPSDNVIVWRWDSDPFGTTAANEDPDGDSNAFAYNLRFPGQYFDSETGLHYNYFRDYDPTTGRYVQSDPIGLDGGINTYGYADGDPIATVDPTGLSAFKIITLCAKGYKVVKEVGFKQAVQAIRRGEDVLASSSKQARRAARAASDAKKAIRDPAHQAGYMKHYHPKPRTGGHVFYSIAAGMTFSHYVECSNCVKSKLATVGDFFNPLSLPQDAIETWEIFTTED